MLAVLALVAEVVSKDYYEQRRNQYNIKLKSHYSEALSILSRQMVLH